MPNAPSTVRRRALVLASTLVAFGGSVLVACGSDDGGRPIFHAPITAAGDTYALTSTGRLISFNRAAPSAVRTSVQTGVAGGQVVGGDLRPNGQMLYVLTMAAGGAGTLLIVDPTTGATTATVALTADPTDTTSPYAGLAGARFGVDFNPVVDRLRVVSDTGQNLRVNVSTGTVITDATINPAGTQPVAAAYTNNLADACATQLLVINATDGNLYVQNPPNDGTVGSPKTTGLGALASTDRVTFDIRTSPARADEGVVVKNATVYGLNVATGAATSQGTLPLAAGEVVTALFVTAPLAGTAETGANGAQQGAMMAILGANVVTFNATTPQKLCSSAAVSGLTAGETILGTDFRPASSTVYGLTSGARLFTLNPFTGVATIGMSLSADSTDTSSPYNTPANLPAADSYGVDFNPMADRLRVVSSSGQNLRINVDTGATITDTPLPAGRAVTAAAYTNSAPTDATGSNPVPGTTSLYDIDTGNNHLYQQNPPNDGTLTDVGALGVTGAALNGFDIVSTRSAVDATSQVNTAYAALSVANTTTGATGTTGTTVANLYTINLSTGAATLINRISDGTATVRGLTRAK